MRALRAAALAILLLPLWCGSAPAVSVGEVAASFEGESLDGETVRLGDYLGKKAVLIKFGSIYCSTCVSSIDDIARIQRKFKSTDLQIVGVNLDVYGIQRVRRFYRGYSALIKYPMIVDEKLAVSRPYDIQSIPAHVVIDKTGVVRYVSTGAAEQDMKILEDVLGRVIRGEAGVEKLMREPPLQIFLPLNFTKTFQESIYVVGKARAGSRVTLSLNGGSRQTVAAMRELFYVRTPLALGSNFVELSLVDELGGRVNQGVVLFREPKIGMGIESPFPEYRFHNEKNETTCRPCHEMNPPKAESKDVAAAARFCMVCHKELTGQRVVHGPVKTGGCSPCHQFDSRPNRYEVIAQGQELCFKCHEPKRKDLIRTYLHGPMAAGLCTICHSPHGSSEKYQLRRYVGDLCIACHEGLRTVQSKKVVHRPLNDGVCTVCHESHSSERNDNFVLKPGNELCLSCHKTMNRETHSHPFGVPPKTERLIKLDRQGNLVCISCHEPHAGDEPKLLVKGGCAKCHG